MQNQNQNERKRNRWRAREGTCREKAETDRERIGNEQSAIGFVGKSKRKATLEWVDLKAEEREEIREIDK